MADILTTLAIVAACSAAYCFIVGEITLNNSQMDKLWSILPAVYVWIVAIKGGMSPRLVLMASLATIWGVRLTWNFARKGAYSWKFWAGEEDYRWKWLRKRSAGAPVINWTIAGAILLILLFLGSSTLAEKISASKYPAYIEYRNTHPRYFPWQ